MKIEVLVSTMHQEDFSLVKKMNIQTDALLINQCNKVGYEEKCFPWGRARMFSFTERGLSKSRNKTIENSNADICIIADDDVVYENNYKNTVSIAYNKYPEADIIAFDVMSSNKERPIASMKEGNVGFYKSMKISSVQITFKRKSLIDNNISFNELFGAGSKYFGGEENILLTKCVRKGLKLKYIKEKLAIVKQAKSTWFRGFDEDYFKTKGAVFYEMSPGLSGLLIAQFALRKLSLYHKETSFINAYRYMLRGLKEYRDSQYLVK